MWKALVLLLDLDQVVEGLMVVLRFAVHLEIVVLLVMEVHLEMNLMVQLG